MILLLEIIQDAYEIFKEETNEFINVPSIHLKLEHSLISIQKWESKWKKAFLGPEKKTNAELIDYIRCMAIQSNAGEDVYQYLSPQNIRKVIQYIEDPMTATTISQNSMNGSGGRGEIVTAEVIYYWMFKLGLPLELEKWHFNRLWMLLQVFNAKDNPKKLSKAEAAQQRMKLNAERRKKYKSKG